MVETSLFAVFLLGLFGGVHCAGMCGGIVAALGMASSTVPVNTPKTLQFHSSPLLPHSALPNALITKPSYLNSVITSSSPILKILSFNLARISTYTALGAVAGAVGSFGFLLNNILPVQQVALVVANLVLIVMGLYVMGVARITHSVERLGRPIWHLIQPFAVKALKQPDNSKLWLAGALWGLVPCGMVYTVLIASMTTAQAADGALLMAAFGLGTLPNLTLMGLSAQWLMRLRKNPIAKSTIGLLFTFIGISGLFQIDAVLNLPVIGELCFRPL